jgi:hypothetical protein
MNLISQYIVFDPEKPYGERWLKLSGPACYPEWKADGCNATAMTYARAWAFASAYGSKQVVVVGTDRAGSEDALMQAAKEATGKQLLEESPWSAFV